MRFRLPHARIYVQLPVESIRSVYVITSAEACQLTRFTGVRFGADSVLKPEIVRLNIPTAG